MAPQTKPVKVIKINVPRHNAQRIGKKLDAEVHKLAKEKKIRVATYQPNPDILPAVENTSDWNSLLITARAERGPQWDIGTQQFHVDQGSDLYYDPTELLEVIRKETGEDEPDSHSHHQHHQQHSQHHQQHLPPQHMVMGHPGQQAPPPGYGHPSSGRHGTPHRNMNNIGPGPGEFHNLPPGMHPQMMGGGGGGGPPQNMGMNINFAASAGPGPGGGFPGTPGGPGMNMNMNMRGPFQGGVPFNGVQQSPGGPGGPGGGQFFNTQDPTGASPMRGGPMQGIMGGMNAGNPGMGVNMGMGGMGMGGGMPGGGIAGMPNRGMGPPGMNMNMSPEMRRVTRGMVEDYPMHG